MSTKKIIKKAVKKVIKTPQFSKPVAAPEPLNPVEKQMERLDDAAAIMADALVAQKISEYVAHLNGIAAKTLSDIK